MGTWESSYREDSASESEADYDDGPDRPFSPEPILPVPSPEDFVQLPIPQQFAYVKPVLTATLNGSYEPAEQRHSDFIRGGKHREDVKKNVVMRGNISVEEVRKFTQYLTWWALGEERRAVAIPDAHLRRTHEEDVVSGSSADLIAEAQDTSDMNRQCQIQLDHTQEQATNSDIPVISAISETWDHTGNIQGEQITEELAKGDNEAGVSVVDGTSIDGEPAGVDRAGHDEGKQEKPLKEDMQGTSAVERSLSEVPFLSFGKLVCELNRT
jgi:hypothetical protein